MKRFSIVCVWLLSCLLVRAQGPDEQYAALHNLFEQADQFAADGQPARALAKYQEAQAELQRFQRANPDWNPDVVKFRLNYLASRVADLSTQVPAKAPAQPTSTAPAVAPSVPAETFAKLERDQAVLKEELRQSQSERALLEAKLKEAWAARPSGVDPQQYTQAQERIKTLEKENATLTAALAEAKAKPAPGVAKAAAAVDASAADQSRKALAEANLQVAELTEKNAALEARLKTLAPGKGTGTTTTALSPPSGNDQIKRLTAERDDLRKKLDAAMRELEARTPTTSSAASPDPRTELVALRTKLSLYESRAAPYTAEELALMRKPASSVAAVPSPQSPPPRRDPPPGGAALAAQAQRYFAAKQYDKAETTYLELLKQDTENVFTLANLAATQLELNKLDECQKNIEHAVKLAPDDAFSVAVLGHLKFRQRNYDDAIEALGRAAKLDPQNAETQNYLGVTFSQKGMRAQAESALRKAVQISPGYADAHNNLALIYLSQQPPSTELARWHYQKALAAGSPPRPEIEKMLDTKRPAPSGQ
jgi:tetratricopeptide (TPR) repeat protein